MLAGGKSAQALGVSRIGFRPMGKARNHDKA
jgi:hypothetical protein